MVGAGALSIQKLIQTPARQEISETAEATASMACIRRVTRKAMAPGAISRPTAKMIPTAVSMATTVSEIAASTDGVREVRNELTGVSYTHLTLPTKRIV